MTLREKIIGIVALSAVAMLAIREGCNRIERDDLIDRVANYSDSAKHYQLKVDGQRVDIAFNKSLLLDNKRQLESMVAKYDTLAKMVSKFKQVQSVTIIKGGAEITGDTIRIDRPIPCNFTPVKIRRDSAHYTFMGTIAPNYFSIDSLVIPNTQSIVIGQRRTGLFKRPENRVEIVNSNPLMKVSNIGSFIVRTPKRWYERPVVGFGIGLIGGAYLYYKVSSNR